MLHNEGEGEWLTSHVEIVQDKTDREPGYTKPTIRLHPSQGRGLGVVVSPPRSEQGSNQTSEQHAMLGNIDEGQDFSSIPPSDWTSDHVGQWLKSFEADSYQNSFQQRLINGKVLLSLTEVDLRSLGVIDSLHIRRFLFEIQDLSVKENSKAETDKADGADEKALLSESRFGVRSPVSDKGIVNKFSFSATSPNNNQIRSPVSRGSLSGARKSFSLTDLHNPQHQHQHQLQQHNLREAIIWCLQRLNDLANQSPMATRVISPSKSKSPASLDKNNHFTFAAERASVSESRTNASPHEEDCTADHKNGEDDQEHSLSRISMSDLEEHMGLGLDHEAIHRKQDWIILPQDSRRVRWDYLIVLLVIYYAFMTPINMAYNLAFADSMAYVGIEIVFNLIFVADVVLNFITAYRPESGKDKGVLIVDPARIAANYLKFWFWIDAIASLPLDLLVKGGGGSKSLRLLRGFKLIRMFRMNRIMKRMEEVAQLSPGVIRLIKLFASMLFMWHWMACLYWYISTEDSKIEISNWTPDQEIETASFGTQYLASIYWAMWVTTGVGGLNPLTGSEFVYTVIATLCGVSMYAFIIGSASTALTNHDTIDSARVRKMDALHQYMQRNNVPEKLQQSIKSYYRYLHAGEGQLETIHLVSDLHVALRSQLQLAVNSALLRKVPLFKNVSQNCLVALIEKLESKIYLPGEFVMRYGDIGRSMYFTVRGQFEVLDGDGSYLGLHRDGTFFGESAMLTNAPRNASIRSIGHGEVLALKKADLKSILVKFPEFRVELAEHAHRPTSIATSGGEESDADLVSPEHHNNQGQLNHALKRVGSDEASHSKHVHHSLSQHALGRAVSDHHSQYFESDLMSDAVDLDEFVTQSHSQMTETPLEDHVAYPYHTLRVNLAPMSRRSRSSVGGRKSSLLKRPHHRNSTRRARSSSKERRRTAHGGRLRYQPTGPSELDARERKRRQTTGPHERSSATNKNYLHTGHHHHNATKRSSFISSYSFQEDSDYTNDDYEHYDSHSELTPLPLPPQSPLMEPTNSNKHKYHIPISKLHDLHLPATLITPTIPEEDKDEDPKIAAGPGAGVSNASSSQQTQTSAQASAQGHADDSSADSSMQDAIQTNLPGQLNKK